MSKKTKSDKEYCKMASEIISLWQIADHKTMASKIDEFSLSINNTHQVWGYLRDELISRKLDINELASVIIYYFASK